MVNGFNIQTQELNEYEKNVLVPAMIRAFVLRVGEDKIITSTKAMRGLKDSGYKINGARFRKCVNHIRVNNLINLLISTSKGYYIATSRSSVERYIESLDQRINSVITVRDAIKYQLEVSKLKF